MTRPIAMIKALGQAAFGAALLSNMLWATALTCVVQRIPKLRKDQQEGMSIVLCQLAWRIALLLAPWVQTIADGDVSKQWGQVLTLMEQYAAEDKREGRRRRPLFLIANHTSFLDTVLGVTTTPAQAMWHMRTYMNDELFKVPILSTVCRAVGHFPVYFTSSDHGAFSVDVKRMEAVERRVDEHLSHGGWLCFFPEGQMNSNPDTILPFRYGGMKKALEFDARIVQLVFRGNQTVWPRKATVGGYPGSVRYSLLPIAPEGARAFVAKARQAGTQGAAEVPDHVLLAERGHELMQEQYDALEAPPAPIGSDRSFFLRRLLMLALQGRSLKPVQQLSKTLSTRVELRSSLRSRL